MKHVVSEYLWRGKAKVILMMAVVMGIMALGSSAMAEDPGFVPPADVKKSDKLEDGWHYKLVLGASISFNDNRKVSGKPDGSTFTLGAKVDSGVTFLSGDHEWRTTLELNESFTRTPVIDEFLKAADSVKFETIYLYTIYEWFGVYGRFALNTSLFPTYDVQAEDVTYAVAYNDGTSLRRTNDRLKLADSFFPLTLKESLGPYAKPLRREEITMEIRLGFGGRHVFADETFAVDDNGDTPDIEVMELRDVHQAGVELTIAMWGEFWDKRISYKATAEAMMPFINNKQGDDDRNAAELTNIELSLLMSFKLVSWASVDYEFKAIREPQVIDDFQIQNMLLLTFSYTLL